MFNGDGPRLIVLGSLLLLFGRACGADAARPDTQPANAYADLDRVVPELKLVVGTTFEAAVSELSRATRANIVVDWADVESAGLRRDMPVRVDLWGVTLDQALRAVEAVVDKEGELSHEAHNEIILVATRGKLKNAGQVVRVYDVRPIIDDLCADRRARTPVGHDGQAPAAAAAASPPTLDEATDGLKRLIEETVEPGSWTDQSWGNGTIHDWAGRLVVTQTPEAHRKVADLLKKLREGGTKGRADLPRP